MILNQSIASVVAICCVHLYGRFSIDLFTIGICCANLFILFSEVPAYGVGESVSSLLPASCRWATTPMAMPSGWRSTR